MMTGRPLSGVSESVASGRISTQGVSVFEVATKDCRLLTDAELAEMADLAVEGPSGYDVEYLSTVRSVPDSEPSKPKWVLITQAHEDGKLRGFAQITRDVSELRALEKEVLEISEREQMRIGHDLHDGIGQELTGVALLTQNLRQKLAQQGLPEEAQAGRIAGLINRTLEQARKLARGFSPVELGPQGLETALRDLAAKVQTSMQRGCVMNFRGQAHLPDDAAALHLFRIAQEAVNNAVRHSHARQIRIELDTIDGVTTLSVHDDGVGIPAMGSRPKGMGISVMRYRARMIGGTLDLQSSGAGTSIICRCPNPQGHESPTARRQEAASHLSQAAVARLAGR